jgi:hypothetical protein
MTRLTLLVVAVLGACLVLAGTAHADETETPTPPPETPPAVETPAAPPAVETAIAPVAGTPEPADETAPPDVEIPPAEETPWPVDETPAPSTGGAARYEVTVGFNTSVTQDDIDEAGAVLRAYDDELEFVVMESWPPIGRALLTTDVTDFCQTVEAELEAKSYIEHVSCEPVEPGPPPAPAPDGEDVIIIAPAPGEPAPDEEDTIIAPAPGETAPGTPEAAIWAPRAGAGSPSDSSWPWWPLAVAGAAAAGTAGLLLAAYQGRKARP